MSRRTMFQKDGKDKRQNRAITLSDTQFTHKYTYSIFIYINSTSKITNSESERKNKEYP